MVSFANHQALEYACGLAEPWSGRTPDPSISLKGRLFGAESLRMTLAIRDGISFVIQTSNPAIASQPFRIRLTIDQRGGTS